MATTKRRKRFVVTRQHSDGRQIVGEVLARPDKNGGPPQALYDYFSTDGWSVLSIIPKAEWKRAKSSGWKIRSGVLENATKGLVFPVVIKQTGHKGGRWGAHQLRSTSKAPSNIKRQLKKNKMPMYHHITVKSWLSPKEAGETIYHELDHAKFAEEEMGKFWSRYKAANGVNPSAEQLRNSWHTSYARDRKIPYDKRPCEVRARLAERTNDTLPLTLDKDSPYT